MAGEANDVIHLLVGEEHHRRQIVTSDFTNRSWAWALLEVKHCHQWVTVDFWCCRGVPAYVLWCWPVVHFLAKNSHSQCHKPHHSSSWKVHVLNLSCSLRGFVPDSALCFLLSSDMVAPRIQSCDCHPTPFVITKDIFPMGQGIKVNDECLILLNGARQLWGNQLGVIHPTVHQQWYYKWILKSFQHYHPYHHHHHFDLYTVKTIRLNVECTIS